MKKFILLFLVLSDSNFFIACDNLNNEVELDISDDDDDDMGIVKHPQWRKFVRIHMETHKLTLAETERKIFDKDGNIEISDVPFLVSILRRLRNDKLKYECGGSIIRNDVILTAAHCIKGANSEFMHIRAGSSFNHTGGVLIKAATYKVHKNFEYGHNKDFDVGIIYLERSLNYSDHIKPIELANEEDEIGLHTLMSVSGTGHVDHKTKQFANTLQGVVVPITNHTQCKEMFVDNPISSNMLCAGYPSGGADSCLFDSGGPLVHNGKQYGIVSFGKGCATTYPGVYSKVSSLRDWIDCNLKGREC